MTLTLTLEPPAKLINANERLHFHVKNQRTQAWRTAAREAVENGFHPYRFERAHITVAYRFPDNRRREVSNLQPTSKALVDGIVDSLLVPDDDDRHVVGPDNRRSYPNGAPLVTITIEEIQ